MMECTIQRAGYDFEQVDNAGEVDFPAFTAIFDTFPWIAEVERYDKLNKGCSATISVTNTSTDNTLWVSVAGNASRFHYLVGYVHLKSRKGLFGFGRSHEKKWVDIYVVPEIEEIKRYFRLFFDGDYVSLAEELQLEKIFDSQRSVK